MKIKSVPFIPQCGHYKGKGIQLSLDEINFLCMVQADGSYSYSSNKDKIYTIRLRFWKLRKIKMCEELLNKLGYEYKKKINNCDHGNYEEGTEFIIYDKNIIKLCETYLDQKKFNYKWLEMTDDEAEYFSWCLSQWDGTIIVHNEDCVEYRYTSIVKQNIDVVSAVYTLHGIGSRIDRGIVVTKKNREYRSLGSPELIREYDTEVSCVTVPSGYIVIRQHGRITLCGNCASVLSVETLGEIFANPNREASANYGIGNDGRIAMFVEEKNRSWCTSSSAVDNRAVTIEVSNSSTGGNWPVSDKAFNALIDLVTDICKRNNIKEIKWKNDRNLVNKVDQQNLVAHQFVAPTACPGPYLLSKFSEIARRVNNNLKATTSTLTSSTYTNMKNDSNEVVIWNFLKSKGFNDFATAGIIGNMFAESSLQSNNLQNTFNTKYNLNDRDYTSRIDNGLMDFINDGSGYGLCQWTYPSRKKGLLNYAKKKGVSISNLQMQLEYFWSEIQGYTTLMNILKSCNDVRTASNAFLLEFEKPLNQSTAVQNARYTYSMNYYNKYKSTTPAAAKSYIVQVTVNALNVRKGPGVGYGIVYTIQDKGKYTIVAESTGSGASKWGKLKSGIGWISLDYVKKI